MGREFLIDYWLWAVTFEFGRYLLSSTSIAGLGWCVLRQGTGRRVAGSVRAA